MTEPDWWSIALSTARWTCVHLGAMSVYPSPQGVNLVAWAQQIVSSAHAVSSASTACKALVSLAASKSIVRDLFGMSEMITWRLREDLGYYIYDTLVDVYSWKQRGSIKVADLVHHVLSIAILALYRVKRAETPVGDTLYAVCSIVMLSTPFLNLCKLLQSAGYEGSLAFKVSSILFVLTFVLCRVVALPAMLYWYNKRQREQQTEESTRDVKLEPEALHSDDDSSSKSADSQSVTASRTLPPLRPLCLGSNALLFALNLYWLRSAVRWSMRG